MTITLAGSPFGAAAGFLYGYGGVPPFAFMPRLRRLGGGFTKIYLFWNQVEPVQGQYDWTAVDRFLDQLDSPDEGLIAVFSASSWATRHPSTLLPPSPAIEPATYYRFVRDLVAHCRGRVRYWQNDAEPNNPIYWSGTAAEFVESLAVFAHAVRDADPSARVVVGGYDGLFGPPGAHQFPNQQAGLAFFDHVLDAGRDLFDLFDLRLYGDPYTIGGRVDVMRGKMQALGCDTPIVCTEYGGPAFFQFAENRKYLHLIHGWTQSIAAGGGASDPAGAAASAVRSLYGQMRALPPQTQMFMQGCPPDLDAKYQRLQARGLVMRNLFALAAGVQKTVYWALPVTPLEGEARDNLMALMYGKIGMIDLREEGPPSPTAAAFARLARALAGVQRVRQIAVADRPTVQLFEATCAGRGRAFVVWDRRDEWTGEQEPPLDAAFDCGGPDGEFDAVDALGERIRVRVAHGRLRLAVSATPIFIEADVAGAPHP